MLAGQAHRRQGGSAAHPVQPLLQGRQDHCLLQDQAASPQGQDPVWTGGPASCCRAAWQYEPVRQAGVSRQVQKGALPAVHCVDMCGCVHAYVRACVCPFVCGPMCVKNVATKQSQASTAREQAFSVVSTGKSLKMLLKATTGLWNWICICCPQSCPQCICIMPHLYSSFLLSDYTIATTLLHLPTPPRSTSLTHICCH